MQEILSAPSPYGLIKEADGLITTVSAVNSALLTGRRTQAIAKIDAHIATLTKDIAAAQGEPACGRLASSRWKLCESRCRRKKASPTSPRPRPRPSRSSMPPLAASRSSCASWPSRRSPRTTDRAEPRRRPVVKKQRIVKPADIVKTTYLETPDDVNDFLDALRQELEKAIANNERIQIR